MPARMPALPARGPLHLARGTHFFKFLERARPILPQQTAERAIGKQLSAGLATRAIICLVRRVTNPLDLRAATRAGLPVTSMYGHPLAKRGDLFGKFRARFSAQFPGPVAKGFA